jgi:hypothetical protein
MVLVPVVPIMGQDEVGLHGLELLERVFDGWIVRKEPVSEAVQDDSFTARALEEQSCSVARFSVTLSRT